MTAAERRRSCRHAAGRASVKGARLRLVFEAELEADRELDLLMAGLADWELHEASGALRPPAPCG